MAKKKEKGMAAKRVLTPTEYSRLKGLQELQARRKYLEQTKQLEMVEKHSPSTYREPDTTARVGNFFTRVLSGARRPHAVTTALYGRQMPMQMSPSQPVRTGRPGRPYGTKDPRYAAYGGVYGYRKAMSHQRQLEKLQARASLAVTPQQQQALAYIRARDNARATAPENQVIPDTSGKFSMRSYFQEIDDAANAVD